MVEKPARRETSGGLGVKEDKSGSGGSARVITYWPVGLTQS